MIEATNAFFRQGGLGRPGWMMLSLFFPLTVRPGIERLAYFCGAGKEMNGARDVLFAGTHQLAAAYCKKNGCAHLPSTTLLGPVNLFCVGPQVLDWVKRLVRANCAPTPGSTPARKRVNMLCQKHQTGHSQCPPAHYQCHG